MKIAASEIKVSGNEQYKKNKFSIGDSAMVISILRDKLYSNPIRVITQEYFSNAVDSHIENGNPETPVEIKCPTVLEPTWEVTDFGVGLTPSQITDVFSRYGVSTKRDSDDKIGGFGIGSKSAWSYSDSYTVTSRTIDHHFNGKENVMVERTYVAYIDETKSGEISMVSENVTDKKQGVTISIPVAEYDIESFCSWTIKSTQFAPVRPIVSCSTCSYITYNVVSSGAGWEKVEGLYRNVAVVGGIRYDINYESMENFCTKDELAMMSNIRSKDGFVLYFDISEIQIAASRESLDYTESTSRKIIDKLSNIATENDQSIIDNAKAKSTVLEAYIYAKNAKDSLIGAETKLEWNGIVLSKMELPSNANRNTKVFSRDENAHYGVKIEKFAFAKTPSEDVILIEKDVSEAMNTKSRIATIFDVYPDIKTVCVYDFINRENRERANKNNFVDLMSGKLSDFEKKKIKRSGSSVSSDTKVYKITSSYKNKLSQTTDYDANKKSLFVETSWNNVVLCGKVISSSNFYSLLVNIGFNPKAIYGLPKKNVKKFKNWVRIDKFIEKRIKKIIGLFDFNKWKIANTGVDFSMNKCCSGIAPLITDKSSKMLEAIAAYSTKYNFKFGENHLSITDIKTMGKYIGVDTPTPSTDQIIVLSQYPLLKNFSYCSYGAATAEEVAEYINFRDSLTNGKPVV